MMDINLISIKLVTGAVPHMWQNYRSQQHNTRQHVCRAWSDLISDRSSTSSAMVLRAYEGESRGGRISRGRIPNELNSRFFTPLTFSSDVTFYGAIFSSIDLIFCRDVLKTILKRGLRSDF